MSNKPRASLFVFAALLSAANLAFGQVHKEYRYTIGPHGSVSVNNQYGPVIVTSAPGNQVVVTATIQSNNVEIDQSQSGDRVEVISHILSDGNPQASRVDYQVMVPAGVSLIVHSSTGPLSAEGLRGDVTMEGATAHVDVRDVSDGHVHVRTLNGPVALTNISNGHVEITSISGDVNLQSVTGPFVQVNCTSGKIVYDGDFGSGGQYSLMSHSGDIEANVPAYAAIDVSARSIKGKVENDFPLQPKHTPFALRPGNSFAGIGGKLGSAAISSVKLFSISGKIHLKKSAVGSQ